jgi:hypothetical protein
VVKIEKDHLPALPLGNSQGLTTGGTVYIFGFPATAEFNQRNPLEATFTQGVISAFKDSQEKDFQVIQTDAKVSQGSSGGPLLNGRGEAIGIITFQSNEFQSGSGDNFAFAIPADTIRAFLSADHQVSLEAGGYGRHFLRGLELMGERHCGKALEEFEAARQGVDRDFNVDRYVQAYVGQCQALVASGQSVDTPQQRAAEMFRSVGAAVWFVVGLIALALVALMRLLRRVKAEEEEIHTLEERLHEEEAIVRKDHELIEKISKEKDGK